MQDEWNDYSPLAPNEEEDDLSSSTNKNSNDQDKDDEDSSESVNSFREEAVLPEADNVNIAYRRTFGYTPIFQVEEGRDGNAGTKVAIPKVSMYFSRGKELQNFNMIEYECLVQIGKKKIETEEGVNDRLMEDGQAPDDLPHRNQKKPGRPASSRFEYDTNFQMQRLFEQLLAAKQSLPFVIGNAPPKRPGSKPLSLLNEGESDDGDYTKRLDSWQRKADTFARYYLLLYRPTSSKDLQDGDFTFAALERWIEDCRTSNHWLKEARLAMFNNRLNGMSISTTNKKLLTDYRGRCRTLWSDYERFKNKEYFAARSAQRAEDLEAAGLTAAEFNLEHMELGKNTNAMMKRQENDISLLGTALLKLVLPSDSPSRTAPDAAATNNLASIHRVGQQVAKDLRRDLNLLTVEKIYSDDREVPVAPVGNRGLNGVMPTEAQPGMNRTNSKTHKLEPDQAVVFDVVVRLVLQGNERKETRPNLVLGPAGTGKTHLILAILDAARSKGKEFICTSFNAIVATAIGGDTFSGAFGWRPKVHQRDPSPFKPSELLQFLDHYRSGNAFPEGDFNSTVVGIILEEISTFSPQMLCFLDIRLRQVTGIDRPFGGLIVLMVGDFGQLGPVLAPAIPNSVVDLCQYDSERDRIFAIRREIARQNHIRNNKKKTQSLIPARPVKFSAPSSPTREVENRHSEGHPYRKGIELILPARLFHLTTQKRAQDTEHRGLVQSMFRGEKFTFHTFDRYPEVKAVDMQEGGDFCDAPILCSTNRERHTITGIRAPIRAFAKGVCVIRWSANLKEQWEQKPSEEYLEQVQFSDPCFWEYFVRGCDGYLTDNLSKRRNLVNGTHIRYHSLSFDTLEKEVQFEELVANTEVGQVASLPFDLRPATVNVELLDLSEESRQYWEESHLSLVSDMVVIPLPCHRVYGKEPTKPILVPGGLHGEYRCSRVLVMNYFPVEPGFAITINKAQGRTIPKVILAISDRKGEGCRLTFCALYVGFSRVKHRDDIRLLLFGDDGYRSSLIYLTKLTADPCNPAFIEGFDKQGGGFSNERVLNKYAELTQTPRPSSAPSGSKRKRN